jgi:hypothetical protein
MEPGIHRNVLGNEDISQTNWSSPFERAKVSNGWDGGRSSSHRIGDHFRSLFLLHFAASLFRGGADSPDDLSNTAFMIALRTIRVVGRILLLTCRMTHDME